MILSCVRLYRLGVWAAQLSRLEPPCKRCRPGLIVIWRGLCLWPKTRVARRC